MPSLYLKNGALAIQGSRISGSCECCDAFSTFIGHTHGQYGPLPPGYNWLSVQTEDDLYLCSFVITGQPNACLSYTLNDSIKSGLEAWVRSGGKYYYQNEYPGCGSASAAALAMSQAGSSMTAQNQLIAGAYTPTVSSSFCVEGLAWSGSASDGCIGGTALLTAAPSGIYPGGSVLSGEKVGDGAVFLSGDSNLQGFSAANVWPTFIERVASNPASVLF